MGRAGQLGWAALGLLLWVSPASAYEDQLTVAVGAGYIHGGGDLLTHGGQLDLAAGLGLDDIWTLRLRATGLWHPESGQRPATPGALLGAELLYLVDVLEWVPYVGLGVDGLLLDPPGGTELGAGGHIVAGLDYLPTREWIFGLDVRVLYARTDAGELWPATLVTLTAQRVFEL